MSRRVVDRPPPPVRAWYGGGYSYPPPPPTPPSGSSTPPTPPSRAAPPTPPEAFGAETRTADGTGLVLGRFLPPHLGHRYVIDFARSCCPWLMIGVWTRPDDPIPAEQRVQALSQMCPDAAVVAI